MSDLFARYKLGWTERVLRRFGRGEDGAHPVAGLTSDAAGNLYGTAMCGANASRTCGLRSVEISDNRAIHWHSKLYLANTSKAVVPQPPPIAAGVFYLHQASSLQEGPLNERPIRRRSRLISKSCQPQKRDPQMKVAIYARVCTDDKGRDPLNQFAAPVYEPAKKPAAHPACPKEVALAGQPCDNSSTAGDNSRGSARTIFSLVPSENTRESESQLGGPTCPRVIRSAQGVSSCRSPHDLSRDSS